MTSLLAALLLTVHLFSAAAWFGALFYRAFFVEPKASRFFVHSADYERFSLYLADGMRLTVVAALLTCGLSGFGLLGLRTPMTSGYAVLMAGKTAAWLAAFAVFAYISGVWFPRRVFAVEAEHRRFRLQGLALAAGMIVLAGAGMFLGLAARL